MAEEHLKALEAARELLLEQRRGLADAWPSLPAGQSQVWLNSFVQVQAGIEAIERAIEHEKRMLPR